MIILKVYDIVRSKRIKILMKTRVSKLMVEISTFDRVNNKEQTKRFGYYVVIFLVEKQKNTDTDLSIWAMNAFFFHFVSVQFRIFNS
jgi:hypothetical protein